MGKLFFISDDGTGPKDLNQVVEEPQRIKIKKPTGILHTALQIIPFPTSFALW
jgi:hypothetical protein